MPAEAGQGICRSQGIDFDPLQSCALQQVVGMAKRCRCAGLDQPLRGRFVESLYQLQSQPDGRLGRSLLDGASRQCQSLVVASIGNSSTPWFRASRTICAGA